MIRPFIIVGLLIGNVLWLALGYEPNKLAMLWIGYAVGVVFMSVPHPRGPRPKGDKNR